jgi:hypothetical protein
MHVMWRLEVAGRGVKLEMDEFFTWWRDHINGPSNEVEVRQNHEARAVGSSISETP